MVSELTKCQEVICTKNIKGKQHKVKKGNQIRLCQKRWHLGKHLKVVRRKAMVISLKQKQSVQTAWERDRVSYLRNSQDSFEDPNVQNGEQEDLRSHRWQRQCRTLKGLDFTHQVEKTLEGSGQRTDRTSFMFQKNHSSYLEKRLKGTGWNGNGCNEK